MIPPCDHTGTPPVLDGFLHFNSSTTSGSASLMRARSRESISPRQSPSSLIFASINSEGDPDFCGALFLTISLSYHIDFHVTVRVEAEASEDAVGRRRGGGLERVRYRVAPIDGSPLCSRRSGHLID